MDDRPLTRRDFARVAAASILLPATGRGLGAEGAAALRETSTRPAHPPRTSWEGYGRAVVIDALAGISWFNVPDPDGGPTEDEMVEAARASGITALNLTVGVVGNRPDPFPRTVESLAEWEGRLARHPDVFREVRGAADILAAKEAGRLGVIFGFQDTVMLEGRLERVRVFHELGVKVVQLTYNDRNLVGDGCLEPGDAGLSRFGHAVVERLNELGMLVDLSHCGTRTTAEAIGASRAPVAVTHSGCRAVFDHPRNKRDEELRALADRGGVMGVYLMPFLNASGAPGEEHVIAHLEHALRVCGEDHVGVGSDQSIVPVDATEAYRSAVAAAGTERQRLGIGAPREDTAPFVPDLNTPRRLERIADLLLARGHATSRVEKVVGGNWLRVMGEMWGG